MDARLLAFLGVALLVTITPGPDMVLVTKHALSCGRWPAMRATAGIATGQVVWAVLAAAGIATLLSASATGLTALKLAGGAYLVFLGLQAIWQTRQHSAKAIDGTPATAPTESGGAVYRQGLMSNLLNAKIGIFSTSLLPQFVTASDPPVVTLAFLGFLQVVIVVAWPSAYIQLVVTVGHVFRRPRVRCWLDRVTGVVLVGLGLRLATTQR